MNSNEASSNVDTSMSLHMVEVISVVAESIKPKHYTKRLLSSRKSKRCLLNVDDLFNAQ